MLILIKGAGDLATGIAYRLYQSGFGVVMTETAQPTAVRCAVSFSQAVYRDEATVGGVTAKLAESPQQALEFIRGGFVAVLIDPECAAIQILKPDGVVDAILAKRNLDTSISDAPAVIGVGPGFTAGLDCHAAVETQRGHDLGRVLYSGSPAPNTGIPGEIGGHSADRLLRAPADGVFTPAAAIGDVVKAGQVTGYAGGLPMEAKISGVLRGLLPEGTPVHKGMKSGDGDPRCQVSHCFSVSDKSLAVGGGVLEALLHRLVTEGGSCLAPCGCVR
jgi:xanthine dehydrogenase accessory factor